MHVGSQMFVDASGALASGDGGVVQTFATHVIPEPHVPQSSTALQPSEIRPQFFCCAAHVVVVHVPVPHTLGVLLAPHVAPPEQSPQ
jgi:hypothetical protein